MAQAAVRRIVLVLVALAPLTGQAQEIEPQIPPLPEPLVEPALPGDVAFARNIALIRADVFTADALVKERDWVDARPHANFPREEIYGAIRDELRTYKVPPFDGALRALAHAVAVRSIKSYVGAFKKVQAALIDADFALHARQKDWPRFTLAVAAATLRDAADEYDAAMTNGRIVHPVGYQSARGIIFETARLVNGVSDALSARDAQATQSLRGTMMHLKGAFASLTAPNQPRVDVETVRALIARARALMQAIK
jgi:hypothetical protein